MLVKARGNYRNLEKKLYFKYMDVKIRVFQAFFMENQIKVPFFTGKTSPKNELVATLPILLV
ncbi:MAG: hypothetical protein HQL69_14825 [Magnetococcales bacterium]|nr:hypothetical protein [Magnetococcales bacterium]